MKCYRDRSRRMRASMKPWKWRTSRRSAWSCASVLLSLLAAARRRIEIPAEVERPQDANFMAWSALLIGLLLPGGSNKELRSYVKGAAESTWQLVNWLTHARNATKTAATITTHAADLLVGHFIQLVEFDRLDHTEQCPTCKSR